MVKTYIVDRPLFELGNTLGEGTTLTSYDLSWRPIVANNVYRVFVGLYSAHEESQLCTF